MSGVTLTLTKKFMCVQGTAFDLSQKTCIGYERPVYGTYFSLPAACLLSRRTATKQS